MSLEHVHLFESRSETFQDGDVLQESVITVSRRCRDQSDTVNVTSSIGTEIHPASHRKVPVSRIIERAENDCVIRIPTNDKDVETIDLIESLPLRFAETGLRVSTGPVVLFRAKEFLMEDANGDNAVPLLMPHHVKPFEVLWPICKQRKPNAFLACAASRRLLLPAKNYVLVKRFTAKEERRRLTAGCFLAKNRRSDFIAVENHVNYIYHETRELSEYETFGVAGILNSTLFDQYFRLLSGSTQVNATELRTMQFPELDAVERLGKRILRSWPLDDLALEEMVLETVAYAMSSSTLTESLH
jgi:adenine-specific DNA-methyltransferase